MPRRVDIQALRAVAVALIVAFHAFPNRLPGGYVGVDVFFVISGYLITRQLLSRQVAQGRGIADFYARRLRRIVPAALFVLLVTLALARLHLPPLAMPQISADAVSTALMFPNVHFAARGVSYLGTNGPSPLLHYWSLGVEDQFYLLWPMAILGLVRLRVRGRRLAAVLALMLLGSLVLSGVLSSATQTATAAWAFFGLHTRLWEFAAGALVCVCEARIAGAITPRIGTAITCAGLGLIAVSAFALDTATPYPGWAAVLPVAGAAAVLVGGAHVSPALSRLLGAPPVQLLGEISYSLYLWHWPLLVLFATPLSSAPTRAALVITALVLAYGTYRLIEQPGRRMRVLTASPARTLLAALAATTVALAVSIPAGLLPRLDAGIAARPAAGAAAALAPDPGFVPANLRPGLEGAEASLVRAAACWQTVADTVPRPCRSGRGSRTIVLFGDSHAGQWLAALRALGAKRGWKVVALIKAACPPALVHVYSTTGDYTECDIWRARALSEIARIAPLLVVVTGARYYVHPGEALASYRSKLATGLVRTLRRLRQTAPVVLIADTPVFASPVPICLSAHLHEPRRCGEAARRALDPRYAGLERRAAKAGGARLIDLDGFLCPRGFCDPIHGNLLLWGDADHLTPEFAAAFAPVLARALG